MMKMKLPDKVRDYIVQKSQNNELVSARCIAIAKILWVERYLTRDQIMIRLKYILGKNYSGIALSNKVFYQDMNVIKQAFHFEKIILRYSRSKEKKGYNLQNQPALLPEFLKMIKASASEVDIHQLEIYKQLSFASRFQQGCDISDTARTVVAYRIRTDNPHLSVQEANQLALQRSYTA